MLVGTSILLPRPVRESAYISNASVISRQIFQILHHKLCVIRLKVAVNLYKTTDEGTGTPDAMKPIIPALTICLLASCASVSPQRFTGPNGNDAYSMKCSGFGRTWDKCYAASNTLCANGYTIVNQVSSTVAAPAFSFTDSPNQTLGIECK